VPIADIIGMCPRKQKAEVLFFEHPRIGAVISGVGLDAAALNRQLATDDVAARKVYVADAEVSVRLREPLLSPVI